jgi:hypothetical protein
VLGVDRFAELQVPLARQRDEPERAQPGKGRGDREVRQVEEPGEHPGVAEHRMDLLGADDRHRDDRHPAGQRGLDEAAAAEPLQLVPLAERLADALEPLGPHPDQFARAQEPFGVLRAGERAAGLAGHRPESGGVEQQVGAQRPQEPPRRVLVVDGDHRHHGVEGPQPAGVVGHEQRGAVVRHVVDAGHLDPEPPPVQRPQDRHQGLLGEVLVEAEVVDPVVAGEPSAEELESGRGLLVPAGTGRVVPLRRVIGPPGERDDGGGRAPGPRDRTGGEATRAAQRSGEVVGAQRDDPRFVHVRPPPPISCG